MSKISTFERDQPKSWLHHEQPLAIRLKGDLSNDDEAEANVSTRRLSFQPCDDPGRWAAVVQKTVISPIVQSPRD
jgi:hypothetical protein